MQRLLVNTRYFILLPIIGLTLAAVFFFIFGGLGLIRLLLELLPAILSGGHDAEARSAVLIEVGYLSNGEQEKLLGGNEFQSTLAQSIVDAIVQFRNAGVTEGGAR